MGRPQLHALDEMISKVRAGRIRRRTFLEGALALGLSSSVAGELLAACGGSGDSSGGNGPALNVTWIGEHDDAGVFTRLVNSFNRTNTDGIFVTYTSGSTDTGQLLTYYLDMLNVRSDASTLISMDIIWPAQFALNQWTVPIQDRWPSDERAKYLPGPIQACTFDGRIWAVPVRTDAGVIYYRKDLLAAPPTTWDELSTMARQIRSSGHARYGYLWQGAQYEGLVCNFVEVLYGYGGTVLDPHNPQRVTIASPEAVEALTTMVGWVDGISPPGVIDYKEGDAANAWLAGDAAFMRNWPYVYSLANTLAESRIISKTAIHPMLHNGTNTVGHSAIGGWQLGINAFSSADKVDAAWRFIQYMIGAETQKILALAASYASTLKSIYTDTEVLAKNPLFRQLGPILQTALPRPVSPLYPDLSNAIQLRVHQALTRQSKPADAIGALDADLRSIVSS
jgi:multiple sugar transport system substrate-binding protein